MWLWIEAASKTTDSETTQSFTSALVLWHTTQPSILISLMENWGSILSEYWRCFLNNCLVTALEGNYPAMPIYSLTGTCLVPSNAFFYRTSVLLKTINTSGQKGESLRVKQQPLLPCRMPSAAQAEACCWNAPGALQIKSKSPPAQNLDNFSTSLRTESCQI